MFNWASKQYHRKRFSVLTEKYLTTRSSILFSALNGTKHQMLCNVSEMRQSIPDHRLLSQGELRLRIKNPTMDQEQRLELYHGAGERARYLGTRFVSKDSANRWLSFDVKQTITEWLQSTGEVYYYFMKRNTAWI